MQQQILIQNQTSEMIENHYMTDFYFWRVNFQSPTQKKIMYVRESRGPSIKDVGIILAIFDTPLPHVGILTLI